MLLHHLLKTSQKCRDYVTAGIFVAVTISTTLSTTNHARADIIGDQTLPENSQVRSSRNTFLIEGGTQIGNSLFHSFSEFSLPENHNAYFNNQPHIQNIFSRVTGTKASYINGLIQANSGANLFIINANGISFGSQARLRIGGSFFASTANSINFADGEKFSVKPEETTPLLTVKTPIGLQFGIVPRPSITVDESLQTPIGVEFGSNPGSIIVQGDPTSTLATLRVAQDQTLALVGGDIFLENADLSNSIYGGRIELGSVASSGFVGLTTTKLGIILKFDDALNLGNIQISPNTYITSMGDLQITGKNIDINNGFIRAGNDITLNASANIQLSKKSFIYSPSSNNISGNFTINAQNLFIQEGSFIGIDKGNFTINVSDTLKLTSNPDTTEEISSSIFANASEDITQSAGNLTINTQHLIVENGSQILTNSSGSAVPSFLSLYESKEAIAKGNLIINATESVILSGSTLNELNPSGLFTRNFDSGESGTLTINTKFLSITDGAQVSTSNFNETKTANLRINATEKIEIIGTSPTGKILTDAQSDFVIDEPVPDASLISFASVLGLRIRGALPSGVLTNTHGLGDAGDIDIKTPILVMRDGGQISTNTFNQGRSGNLTVDATEQIQLLGTSASGLSTGLFTTTNPNAKISTNTLNQEPSGNLTVEVTEPIQHLDTSASSLSIGLFTTTNPNATGENGTLNILTGNLLVQDGAQVSASTFGARKGGLLHIQAREEIKLIGVSHQNVPSGLFTQATAGSTADAGEMIINTSTLLVRDGAQISASTFGSGKGGNLTVEATESIQLIGVSPLTLPSGLFTQANSGSTGDAGELTVSTSTLLVKDGAQISASTFGSGKAGNLTVKATEGIELIGSSGKENVFPSGLFAVTVGKAAGDAGNLIVDTPTLLVRDGAQIAASSSSPGKAGNLTVNVPEKVQLIGTEKNGAFPSGLFVSATPDSTGDAGNLILNTDLLQIWQSAGIAVRNRGKGSAGNLFVNARSIDLNDKAFISADTRGVSKDTNQPQANINLRSQELLWLRGNSSITTNAIGDNVIGGNININTKLLAAFENSDISANSINFRGGSVIISADGIIGTQFRNSLTSESDITATGATPELSGTVEINTPEVDPSRGLTELPSNLIDVSNQIAQKCRAGEAITQQTNQFVITGKGGIPTTPYDALQNDSAIAPWVNVSNINNTAQNPTNYTQTSPVSETNIVEAQALVADSQGNLILTASVPNSTPQKPAFRHPVCNS